MHFFIFPSYNFRKESRKQTGHLLTGFFLSGFTGVPLLRLHRKYCFADPLFLSCQKKWAKRGAGCGSDCTAVPQKGPVEERCGQHTRPFLQNYTTAPPAWGQRSHRKQLPRKGMVKHAAVEIAGHLRMRRWCKFLMERVDDPVRPVCFFVNVCRGRCRGRCLHRPAQCAPFLRKSAANSLVP